MLLVSLVVLDSLISSKFFSLKSVAELNIFFFLFKS